MHFHGITGSDNKTLENHTNVGTVQKTGQQDIVVNQYNVLSTQLSCKAMTMIALTTMHHKRQTHKFRYHFLQPHSRRTYLYLLLTI
jgi:hypothetical protein